MKLRIHTILLQLVLFSTLGLFGPATAEAKLSGLTSNPIESRTASIVAAAPACKYVIGLGISTASARTNYAAVKPGDTVCIAAGSRGSLTLENFQGTAGNPIIFINSGGQVTFNGSSDAAITFQNSRYFRLTGSGDPGNEYGIRINGNYSKGVHAHLKSSDMEIDHIEVSNTSGSGMTANSKSDCADGSDNSFDFDGDGKIKNDLDDVVTQGNFTQYNTILHHNYIHDIQHEGFYIGANRTIYASSGQGNPSNCPVPPTNPLNPILRGLRVYSNILERIGWDAINVKGTPTDCLVYGNEVYGDGLATNRYPFQEGAVALSLNSHCDVYNNYIQGGQGPGIKSTGAGGKIYNNIIVSQGQGRSSTDKAGSGIFISADEPNGAYYIWNNTIMTPKSFGVCFADNHVANNVVQNNLIVNPGASGDGGFMQVSRQGQTSVTQNFLSRNIAEVKFVNPAANDYSLQSGSPVINAGLDLSSQGIRVDYAGVSRPQGAKYDIGAYEFVGGTPSTPTPTPVIPTPTPVVPTATPIIPLPTAGSTPPAGSGDYLIRVGDTWRYFKGVSEASNPVTAWRQVGFDDRNWLAGPTSIGYGYSSLATVLNDMRYKYVSVFMRRTFQVPDPARVQTLSLEIDYDDGFVAYLNGMEIARRQIGNPGAPLAYNTGTQIDHPAGTLESINLTPFINLLRPGENILAIQAHNQGLNSSDFAMIPALRGVQTGSPVPTNTPIATPTTPPTAVSPTATPVKTPTPPSTPLPGGNITARIETDPVTHDTDAANDPAIWIHPTDPALSLIVGTDRKGALEVYDLAGRKLQLIPIATGNVDVSYNFPLGGERVALVAALNKTTGDLAAFKVNANTRMLEDVVAGEVSVGGGGTALYHSPMSGKTYYFSNGGSTLKQYELFDNGSGKVNTKLVRTVSYGGSGKSEGVVADDILGQVYVSEETIGIWKLSAEPNGGSNKTLVDKPIAQGGHLQPDVEGLTIYYKSDGTGYLIASSQGNNSYTVYTREGQNQYLGTFKIEDGEVDGVSSTGGIDVINFPLGATFPAGAFVAQDGSNTNNAATLNQNFKLVPWERIASKLGLSLDTGWDPRQVGAGDMLTLTDVAVNTPDVAPVEVSIPETAIEPPAPTQEPLLEPIPPQEPVVEPIEEPSTVNADVNGDQVVNILDLVFVASHYGSSQPEADVDGNATVDILDLALVARLFDQASPEAPALPVETPSPALPTETPLLQPTDMPPVEPIPTETSMPQPIPTETPIPQPIPTESLPPTATLAPPTPSETSTPTLEPLTPTETLTPTLELPTPTETPTTTPEAETTP